MFLPDMCEKLTKFSVNLTVCSNCQIDGEDFINFYGLLRKHELYNPDKSYLRMVEVIQLLEYTLIRLDNTKNRRQILLFC